jgi:Skp family chaperone for outer membrane proteins
VFFVFLVSANAQEDCSLGIGATDTDILVQVFQLRPEQKIKLEEFHAAISKEIQSMDGEIETLIETHPQTTPEDLIAFGAKHKVLEDRVKDIFQKYDLKLLALFNEKQYQRYVSLCKEVLRQPLVAVPE